MVNFNVDNFADILAKDKRYQPRAYAFLCAVIGFLSKAMPDRDESKCNFSAEEILEGFKNLALDEYGPLAYRVLTEWGVKSTEDIGEMVVNLVESKRFAPRPDDSIESFQCGYDFKETFYDIFQA